MMGLGLGNLLRTVTTPIKNFLSHAKTSLSSFLFSHSPNSACMSINCLEVLPCRTSLNCHDTSGCMTINCPPHRSVLPEHSSRAYGPRDCLTKRMDSTTSCASLQNPCPNLDPSSSTDSLQTHDSLVTPESPYSPSPVESLEEGTTEGVTQVQTHDPDATHVAEVTEDIQVRTNDSLVTTLSWLSLEPDPDPLSWLSLEPDPDPLSWLSLEPDPDPLSDHQ